MFCFQKLENIKPLQSMFKELVNLKQRSLNATYDSVGFKLLSRLRLKCSHFNEYKFRHNFKDAPSPKCDCRFETEKTDHFFLCCPSFAENRQKPNSLFEIYVSLKNLNDKMLLAILLSGSDKYKDTVNKEVLVHKINSHKTTKHFTRPVFWPLIPLYDHHFNFFSLFTFVL